MKLLSFNTFSKTAICVLAFLPSLASAGIFDDDEARKAILDLRAKLAELNTKIDARLNDKADKTSILELSSQHELLRQEISALRGQLEVVINDLANAQKRQQDFYMDLDKRLRNLEPKKVTIDGQEMIVDPSEQRSFNAAMALYNSGDYANAATSFTNFNNAYASSAYASQALYWLGNSYYAQKDCKNTIITLQSLTTKYPDYAKTPDAMLNTAACQLVLKDKKASRKTLDAVIANFPGTEAARAAKSQIALTK